MYPGLVHELAEARSRDLRARAEEARRARRVRPPRPRLTVRVPLGRALVHLGERLLDRGAGVRHTLPQ